jgi:hypothetical protein
VASQSSRRLNAEESRLVEGWARFGNRDELKRICKGILARPRQGYAVAFEAQHIIRAHAEYWRLDVPIEANDTGKNRALLKKGPSIVRQLDRALRDMIDLHRQAEERQHWYGKKIVAGEIKGPAARSWARFPRLYAHARKALGADPLRLTLLDTPREMWLIPRPGNPEKRRNGKLIGALRGVGLTKLQVDDVIHALGWTVR